MEEGLSEERGKQRQVAASRRVGHPDYRLRHDETSFGDTYGRIRRTFCVRKAERTGPVRTAEGADRQAAFPTDVSGLRPWSRVRTNPCGHAKRDGPSRVPLQLERVYNDSERKAVLPQRAHRWSHLAHQLLHDSRTGNRLRAAYLRTIRRGVRRTAATLHRATGGGTRTDSVSAGLATGPSTTAEVCRVCTALAERDLLEPLAQGLCHRMAEGLRALRGQRTAVGTGHRGFRPLEPAIRPVVQDAVLRLRHRACQQRCRFATGTPRTA